MCNITISIISDGSSVCSCGAHVQYRLQCMQLYRYVYVSALYRCVYVSAVPACILSAVLA
jgi:hypothetical protein